MSPKLRLAYCRRAALGAPPNTRLLPRPTRRPPGQGLHLSTIIFMEHSGSASHPLLPLVTCSCTRTSRGGLPGGSWHRHGRGPPGFRAPHTEKNQGRSSQCCPGAPWSAVSGRRGTQCPVMEAVWGRRLWVRAQHRQGAAKRGRSPPAHSRPRAPTWTQTCKATYPQEWDGQEWLG